MTTIGDVDITATGVVHATHHDGDLPPAVLVRPDGYVAWADDNPPTAADAAAAIAGWVKG
jgi:hypothetical protein